MTDNEIIKALEYCSDEGRKIVKIALYTKLQIALEH